MGHSVYQLGRDLEFSERSPLGNANPIENKNFYQQFLYRKKQSIIFSRKILSEPFCL